MEKQWWQSKTIIAALVTLIAVVLDILGFNFGADDQSQLVDIILKILEVGGTLGAIWGRTVASKNIQ